jgi:hypothetical protein
MVAHLTVMQHSRSESTPADHGKMCLAPGGSPPGTALYRGLAS